MPIHTISDKLSNIDSKVLTTAVAAGIGAYALKVYSGGKKSVWEREWGGKMIIIAAPPEPTTFALMHKLLHLPSPPQILYLPPIASPLPQSLLTVLHAMKLAASGNPLAQLNCEPLPPTPGAVRDFVRKWSSTPYGTAGEGGRRVDAIVLGGNWECAAFDVHDAWDPSAHPGVSWTPSQMHFHLITSLLPHLLKAPAERNIRIIQLVSPGWSAALPGVEKTMKGQRVEPEHGVLADAGKRGVVALLAGERLSVILNTLASAAYSKREVVPDPNAPAKKRDMSVQSNILSISVIMPWARDEVVRPIWGMDSLIHFLLWYLLYPIVMLLTPSPAQSVQSILFALNAPVAYINDATAQFTGDTDKSASDNLGGEDVDGEPKPKDTSKKDEPLPENQRSIRQGSVVRDCRTIELPPVLRDEKLTRATYDRIEEEVTRGVVESEAAEDARGQPRKPKGKKDEKITVNVAGGVPGQPPSRAEKAAVGGLKAEAKATEIGDKIDQQAAHETQHVAQKPVQAAGQGQKKADELAQQHRTDPADTAKSSAPAHDAAKQAQSEQRAQELKQQHGLDAVKPGESFADALKEGTDEDPHKHKASTHTGTHDAHVHKGESFADAIKERTGQQAQHQPAQHQPAQHQQAQHQQTQHQQTQHQQTQHQQAQTQKPGSAHTGPHDAHVHKGESFADAIKEHAGQHAQPQHQAQHAQPQAHTQPAHTQQHAQQPTQQPIQQHTQPHVAQGQGKVHPGESFAAALKEHQK